MEDVMEEQRGEDRTGTFRASRQGTTHGPLISNNHAAATSTAPFFGVDHRPRY